MNQGDKLEPYGRNPKHHAPLRSSDCDVLDERNLAEAESACTAARHPTTHSSPDIARGFLRRRVKLGINIDHVATLRQQRRGKEPDPILAALLAEAAGADSIVCHLREDRRHIQEQDLSTLRHTIKTKLNLEMAASPEIIKIACQKKPDWVTLVPEKRAELTTEGGLAVKKQARHLKDVVSEFKKFEIPVSLFIDADTNQIEVAAKTGAAIVEFHTGRYANAVTGKERGSELKKIAAGSRMAKSLGLKVAAGHGLDYRNVLPIIRIPEIEELNIGYAIVGRAIFVGLEEAVREMIRLIR